METTVTFTLKVCPRRVPLLHVDGGSGCICAYQGNQGGGIFDQSGGRQIAQSCVADLDGADDANVLSRASAEKTKPEPNVPLPRTVTTLRWTLLAKPARLLRIAKK